MDMKSKCNTDSNSDTNQNISGNREATSERSRARLMMQYPNIDIQEGRRLRSVRRRLFQDEDDDNETESVRNSGVEDNCFFEETRKNRENAKERWNFDFEKEEPLPGRYVWVKLDQHGNEICNPSETKNRIENLQTMQEEDVQDDDITMQDHVEGKDDEKLTDST
ncbi:cyclin-dependent kinase inhibitor 2 isoform X1 [Bombus terrestris]|uniref:Cyclin-dependent kinase inhibitor 2 isoform X1 n=1 Tax=Bombus terrestris TaxID=30195 RepID=A0A9B0BVW0_BOMTE|nr:cyclin-dependent kinase inhibitor 2 isoform X1 [Bombus terrestris]